VSDSGLRALLGKHSLHLRRELGQNFIVEEKVAERVVALSGIDPSRSVIEVGTGLGMLTRAIAARAKSVITVEIDSGLVSTAQAEGLLPANVELIHADALKLDLAEMIRKLKREQGGGVCFVANLPFSAASPLLRRLLDLRHELVDWSVILQKEVADRLFAPVGSGDYGSFAVLHHLTAQLGRQSVLSANCFFPKPRVDSALVTICARDDAGLQADELERVERVVRAAFGKRRKTVLNALRGGGVAGDSKDLQATLERVSIDPRARAETIAPESFLALTRALTSEVRDGTG